MLPIPSVRIQLLFVGRPFRYSDGHISILDQAVQYASKRLPILSRTGYSLLSVSVVSNDPGLIVRLDLFSINVLPADNITLAVPSIEV